MVVLLDPFRGLSTRRNSAETQQLVHAPSSKPEIKNGKSSARISCTNVSPVHRAGAVSATLTKGLPIVLTKIQYQTQPRLPLNNKTKVCGFFFSKLVFLTLERRGLWALRFSVRENSD